MTYQKHQWRSAVPTLTGDYWVYASTWDKPKLIKIFKDNDGILVVYHNRHSILNMDLDKFVDEFPDIKWCLPEVPDTPLPGSLSYAAAALYSSQHGVAMKLNASNPEIFLVCNSHNDLYMYERSVVDCKLVFKRHQLTVDDLRPRNTWSATSLTNNNMLRFDNSYKPLEDFCYKMPIKPGYYWFQHDEFGSIPIIVRILCSNKRYSSLLIERPNSKIRIYKTSLCDFLKDYPNALWKPVPPAELTAAQEECDGSKEWDDF